MGILLALKKTEKAEIFLYSINEQSNFLNEIEGTNKNDFKKLIRHIDHLAIFGELKDEEKFKHITKNIYEIKANKLRVFCLLLSGVKPKTFILNHYYKKQKKKALGKEIDKAQKLADEIMGQIKNGTLTVGG